MNISEIEASKENDANCRLFWQSLSPKISICDNIVLTIPACYMITPFGFPVDPEV